MPNIRAINIFNPMLLLCLNAMLALTSNIVGFFLVIGLYRKTQDASLMSIAIFASIAPRIFLGFFAGKVTDKFGKDKIIKLSLLALVCIYLINFVVFYGGSNVSILYILLLEGAIGLVAAFYEIALLASLSSFADKKNHRLVYSVMNLTLNSSYILSPIIAGAIYTIVDISQVFIIASFCSFVLFCFIGKMEFSSILKGAKKSIDFRAWDFIKKSPILLNLLIYFSLFNLINGLASGLITVYILKSFTGSASKLAIFNFFIAVGTLMGSIFSFKDSKLSPVLTIAYGGLIASTLGRVIFGIASSFYILSIVAAIRMATIQVTNTSNQIIWSNETPPDKQGAVFGLRRLVAQGGYPVAVLLGGFFYKFIESYVKANVFGYFFVVCGALEIMVSIYLLLSFKRSNSSAETGSVAKILMREYSQELNQQIRGTGNAKAV